MEPIESFKEVLRYLKDKEIVYTIAKSVITYFYLNDEKIIVRSPSAHYTIDYEQFIQLFIHETFYLYTDKQEIVDEQKDEAYYSWKAQGTN